ncbi:MAG: type II toxin-antitoxin system VapC family toxin [Pseudomonadota bacterium]
MAALRYLLDTNICIYITKARPPAVLERFRQLRSGEVAMSAITWGELCHGAEKSAQREAVLAALERLRELIPVLELSADAGAEYGRMLAHLQRSGTVIGGNDLWIAAHACALGLTLLTNKLREFERVPALALENWA